MEYKTLGKSDLKVSKICLGTMTFGEQNSESEAHQQLDYATSHGINFIDTAEMYPVPPLAKTYGLTEEYIGRWKKLKNERDKIILATKVVGRDLGMPHIREGQSTLNKKNIKKALEASLKRLNTDYIDLYQMHWPDRETNYFGKLNYKHLPQDDGTPIEETLEALSDFVKEGVIRYIGVSNETPWGVMKYINLEQNQNLVRISSIQNPYNLLNRSFEIGLSEISLREEVSMLAYSPLAFGMLTGKYLNGAQPKKSRLTLYNRFTRYQKKESWEATLKYVNLAKKYNLSPTQMALQFVTSRPFTTSTIIGATTMEQLKENISSINVKLSSELIDELELIHTSIPNPAP